MNLSEADNEKGLTRREGDELSEVRNVSSPRRKDYFTRGRRVEKAAHLGGGGGGRGVFIGTCPFCGQ